MKWILLIALSGSWQGAEWLLSETRASVGSSWQEGHSGMTFAEFRRLEDRADLSVQAFKVSASRDLRDAWRRLTEASKPYTGPSFPYSGLLLGDQLRQHDAGGLMLAIRNDRTFVRIQVGYRGAGPKGGVVWRDGNKAQDKIDIEGIARKIIALSAGRDSTQRPNVTVAGQSMACRRGLDGKDMVPLDAWCSARGVTLNRNERLGTASFTRNDRNVIVPLGARSIKVGSEWRELGDTVAIHDARWFVPLTALEGT